MTRPRVLGIGGSLRQGSTTLAALRFSLDCAERAGAEIAQLPLRDLALPPYDDQTDPGTYPSGVTTLLAETRSADALILASPVYHGTMSGSLKNALDYLELLADDEPAWLEGKVAGIVTVCGGRPRGDAILSLEIACRALRALTVPVSVSITEDDFDDGVLSSMTIKRRLERLSLAVVRTADALRSRP